jgi:hypothetical protein
MNKIQIQIIREMICERRSALQNLIDQERRKLRTQSMITIPSIAVCDGLPVKAKKYLKVFCPK